MTRLTYGHERLRPPRLLVRLATLRPVRRPLRPPVLVSIVTGHRTSDSVTGKTPTAPRKLVKGGQGV